MKITNIMANWHSPNVSTSLCCSACGHKLGGDEKFCSSCGRQLKIKPKLVAADLVIDMLNKTVWASHKTIKK